LTWRFPFQSVKHDALTLELTNLGAMTCNFLVERGQRLTRFSDLRLQLGFLPALLIIRAACSAEIQVADAGADGGGA
jgi:hypothetical protein